MMVSVPVFAKGQKTQTRKVVTLHEHAVDNPALMPVTVRIMTNGPMPDKADRHPHGNPTDHKRPSARKP